MTSQAFSASDIAGSVILGLEFDDVLNRVRGRYSLDGSSTVNLLAIMLQLPPCPLAAPRIETLHTHGTGCTYSAAIVALLARGETLVNAVREAKEFISSSISAPAQGTNLSLAP